MDSQPEAGRRYGHGTAAEGKIADLEQLLKAYRDGRIAERFGRR